MVSKFETYIRGYKAYLKLEKSLSDNSIESYLFDIAKFVQYLDYVNLDVSPSDVELNHLKDFITWINTLGMSAHSQARIISGLRSFFNFLILEDIIRVNPTELIEFPRLGRQLPDTLSLEEINL